MKLTSTFSLQLQALKNIYILIFWHWENERSDQDERNVKTDAQFKPGDREDPIMQHKRNTNDIRHQMSLWNTLTIEHTIRNSSTSRNG